jgi:hypothetical protein
MLPILEGRLLAADEEEPDYLPSPAQPAKAPKRSARAAKR